MKKRLNADWFLEAYEYIKIYLLCASCIASGIGLYHVVGHLFHHAFGYFK